MNELKEELKELKEKFDMNEYGQVNENGHYLLKEVEKLITKKELEARIDEWGLVSECRHSAAIEEELYFNSGMNDRINQLTSQLKGKE